MNEEIVSGTDKLIAISAKTSNGEPNLAIAQLLLSAATLAYTIGMSGEDLGHGFALAMKETYYRNRGRLQ